MEDILKIMKDIYEKPGKRNSEYYKKEYGEKIFERFSDFALSANDPLAEATKENAKLKLTSAGVREYHRLLGEKKEVQRTKAAVYATTGMACASAGILISSLEGIEILGIGSSIYFLISAIFLLFALALIGVGIWNIYRE